MTLFSQLTPNIHGKRVAPLVSTITKGHTGWVPGILKEQELKQHRIWLLPPHQLYSFLGFGGFNKIDFTY